MLPEQAAYELNQGGEVVRDYRREMYAVLMAAASESKAIDHAGLLWDCATAAGETLKAEHNRSHNYALMLRRLIRRIGQGKDLAALKETADQAAGLLARLGGNGIGEILR